MPAVLWVALGGALGASGRFWVNQLLSRHGGMLASTLTVNVLGCLLLGCFLQWLLPREPGVWQDSTRWFFATGFCGAFTTMSALSLETRQLFESGQAGFAVGYALLSVALSVAGLIAGIAIARMIA